MDRRRIDKDSQKGKMKKKTQNHIDKKLEKCSNRQPGQKGGTETDRLKMIIIAEEVKKIKLDG